MMFLERLAKKAEAEGQDNCVRQKNIENNLEVKPRVDIYYYLFYSHFIDRVFYANFEDSYFYTLPTSQARTGLGAGSSSSSLKEEEEEAEEGDFSR